MPEFKMPKWMNELIKLENNKEFSQLTHNYFKFAVMRIMQEMREKYNVPKEDIATLNIAIFARMLNEACYAVGVHIKEDYPIKNIFSKEQLLTLVRVLNGESLSQFSREDIDIDIEKGLQKFKEFILNNQDFRL
jgi:hypothetical protein